MKLPGEADRTCRARCLGAPNSGPCATSKAPWRRNGADFLEQNVHAAPVKKANKPQKALASCLEGFKWR
jgi:hypothetical protein